MEMVTQYTFAGDYTGKLSVYRYMFAPPKILFVVEAIDKAVTEVSKFDAGTIDVQLCVVVLNCTFYDRRLVCDRNHRRKLREIQHYP